MTRFVATPRDAVEGVALNPRGVAADEGNVATDLLTGLPDRAAWDEGLPALLDGAGRERIPVCVALLEIDGFAEFVAARGAVHGDRLLKECAAAWRSRLRDGDLLARYADDQFAIALTGCGEREATGLLERMVAMAPRGRTCAVGVAGWEAGERAPRLIARAEAALVVARHGDARHAA